MIKNRDRFPLVKAIFPGLLPSFIKVIIYRIKGYKIGKKVKLGPGCVIIGKNVTIGHHSKIGFFTMILCKQIKIGNYVEIGSMTYINTENIEIGEDTVIRERVSIGGLITPDSKLVIGERCRIMQNTILNPTLPIILGDECGIGGNCSFFTHGFWLSKIEGYPVDYKPITLGNNVWIPWNVTVNPGVSIGDGAVIAARSHVTKSIPARTVAAGNPAKVRVRKFPVIPDEHQKKKIFSEIIEEFIAYLKYHGFSLERVDADNYLSVNITKKRQRHHFLVIYSDDKIIDNLEKENNVTVYWKRILKPQFSGNRKMVIDMTTKVRVGNSTIGGEFVKYLSRFGIRLKRLDA